MSLRATSTKPKSGRVGTAALLTLLLCVHANGQAVPYARTFSKPKAEVEQALKDLQAYSGQKLPVVDGFVATTQHPLSQYERAFYQFSIELLPGTPADSTIVQVTAKITAWYADKDPTKSGYQTLPSNGRLELDLLDRLDEKFGNKPQPGSPRALATSGISAPAPKLNLGGLNMAMVGGNPIQPAAGTEELNRLKAAREAEEKRMRELNAELESLQEIKKNQVHPPNLVTVKRPATPVLAHAGDEAHTLFKASVNDEFEYLDMEGEWVHVQISGASRGYIRRSALELPEAIGGGGEESGRTASSEKQAAFRVTREETSVFPGDWEALKGKTVKIYTVQVAVQDAKETDARAKLNFAAALMKKFAAEGSTVAAPVDGAVVIFDAADGGLAGATLANIQQLAKGAMSEEAFWKECYLDPPETFQPRH